MRSYQLLKNATFAKAGESYASIQLPHTWNALDGQDGGLPTGRPVSGM